MSLLSLVRLYLRMFCQLGMLILFNVHFTCQVWWEAGKTTFASRMLESHPPFFLRTRPLSHPNFSLPTQPFGHGSLDNIPSAQKGWSE